MGGGGGAFDFATKPQTHFGKNAHAELLWPGLKALVFFLLLS